MDQNTYHYELMYAISGVAQQNQVDDIVRKINQFVESNGGDVLEVDEWGNQRLAYEIDKKRSGYFVNVYFKGPGELVPKVERQLQINDEVLRYLTLRMDAKMQRHYRNQAQRPSSDDEGADEAEGEEAPSLSYNDESVEYVDYKDTEKLEQYINNQGKILPRRVTDLSAKMQRQVTQAIKRARHLALMPYVSESIR
jgi:small subunit ribosomal protein S6